MEDPQAIQEDSIKQRLRNSPRYPATSLTPRGAPRPADDPRATDDSLILSELREPEAIREQDAATSNAELRSEFQELLAVTKQEITSMTRDMMKEMIHEIQDSWQTRATGNQQMTNPTVVGNVRDAFQSRGSQSTLSSRPEFQNRQSHSILSSRPEFQGPRDHETLHATEAEANSHWQLPENEYQSGPMQNSSRLNASNYIKLPPFTGKERWDIWYNRFVDVANLRGWNRKWQDYVYIQCEYKSTKQKIKHLLREENKVKENKIS